MSATIRLKVKVVMLWRYDRMVIPVPRSLLRKFLELSPGGYSSAGVMLEGLMRTI